MITDFDKFIGLDNDIEDIIRKVKEINWFNNCGNNYAEKLEYNYILDENIEATKKNIVRYNNYNGIITAENLFSEANRRIFSFFHNNGKINLDLDFTKNSWVKLREKIVSGFSESEVVFHDTNGGFDFIDITKKCKERLDIKETIPNFIFVLLCSIVMETYCKRVFPEIPTFFEKVSKIFIDGHLITGWKGKFPSPYLFVDKTIDKNKGNLILW
jgi:hypothetical protein